MSCFDQISLLLLKKIQVHSRIIRCLLAFLLHCFNWAEKYWLFQEPFPGQGDITSRQSCPGSYIYPDIDARVFHAAFPPICKQVPLAYPDLWPSTGRHFHGWGRDETRQPGNDKNARPGSLKNEYQGDPWSV